MWKQKVGAGLLVRFVAGQALAFALNKVACREIVAESVAAHAALSFLRKLECRNEGSRQVGVE